MHNQLKSIQTQNNSFLSESSHLQLVRTFINEYCHLEEHLLDENLISIQRWTKEFSLLLKNATQSLVFARGIRILKFIRNIIFRFFYNNLKCYNNRTESKDNTTRRMRIQCNPKALAMTIKHLHESNELKENITL